jgi:ribose transport system permease protein
MTALLDILRRNRLPLVLVLACGALGASNPSFFSVNNLINILLQTSVSAILAIGMTYVVIVGGIDLSIGSVVALTGMLVGMMLQSGLPMVLVCLLGLAIGAVLGLLNGVLIQRWTIPPFIVTLGTMSALRGAALMLTDGRSISNFSVGFLWLGNGKALGLPIPVVMAVFLATVAGIYLRLSIGGIRLFAIGGNPQAARLAGLPIGRYIIATYIVSGIASGAGALILTSRLDAALPTSGTGYELDAIAATVIGGASLAGGYGSVLGAVCGALLVATLRNGLSLVNVSSYLQQVVIGIVIVSSVALNRTSHRP